jgi:hypothetical protein
LPEPPPAEPPPAWELRLLWEITTPGAPIVAAAIKTASAIDLLRRVI